MSLFSPTFLSNKITVACQVKEFFYLRLFNKQLKYKDNLLHHAFSMTN